MKILKVVGAKGLEPSTPWSQTRYSNQTELRPDTERHYTLVIIKKTFILYKRSTCFKRIIFVRVYL